MATPDAIPTIYIVDDDRDFRESLAAMLSGDRCRVVPTASAAEFLAVATSAPSACALVDLNMPEADGFDVLAGLRERAIELPVIMMTGQGGVAAAVRAMKSGAVDFIEKPFTNDDLQARIEAALDVGRKRAGRAERRQEFRERLARLTEREREVFDRMIMGKPTKAIAHELEISPRTVEIHRARVLEKLDSTGIADLIRASMHAGVGDSGNG